LHGSVPTDQAGYAKLELIYTVCKHVGCIIATPQYMSEERGPWKRESSTLVYRNHWIKVHEDKVIRPDGKPGIYGYLEKPPGAFIIPQEADGSIYLLRQFRYPVNTIVTELPCGVIENSSDPFGEAQRELFEETNITAGKIEKLGQFFVGAGHETTAIQVFLATNLDTGKLSTGRQEGNEAILEVIRVSREEIIAMIKNGELNCGISLAAIMLALAHSS
jgi:8-oxo-dGTP pyrophosphatase MutT (NUDIX family)